MFQCGKPFVSDDVVILNGTEEEVEEMRSKMLERRLKAKLEKVGALVDFMFIGRQIWNLA